MIAVSADDGIYRILDDPWRLLAEEYPCKGAKESES
jgi:hypothetical protein